MMFPIADADPGVLGFLTTVRPNGQRQKLGDAQRRERRTGS